MGSRALFITWSRRQLQSHLAWLLLGIVVGMVAGTLLLGGEVDRLELERRRLEVELARRTDQISRLEESLEVARRRPAIREVEARLLEFPDPRRKVELEAAAHELYRHAIGSDLSELDPSILRAVAHNRTVRLEEATYTLTVDFIWAVGDRLVVWLRAAEGDADRAPGP